VRATDRVGDLQRNVDGLLTDWDDDVANDVFAMNMDLDEPRDLRRAAVERVVRDIGLAETDPEVRSDDVASGVDAALPAATSVSPFDRTWWRPGGRGAIKVSILVSPERIPRLQRLDIEPVGAPGPALVQAAERFLADDAAADLPRAARVRFGSLRLGRPIHGDGRTSTTFEIVSERGQAELLVTIDPVSGAVISVVLRERERDAPAEAW
jgi:hypothetical protein